jgi:hypothetical protein
MKIMVSNTIMFIRATWLFTLAIPAVAVIVMLCSTDARDDITTHPLEFVLGIITWELINILAVLGHWDFVEKFGKSWFSK